MTSKCEYSSRHQRKYITVGGRQDDVDVDIAPLIEELWKADIEIIGSCQEVERGFVQLHFYALDDASKFFGAVARYSTKAKSIYRRIQDTSESPTPRRMHWTYDIYPQDINEDYLSEEKDNNYEGEYGHPCFVFGCVLEFPRKDCRVVLKRMKRYNERRRFASPSPMSGQPEIGIETPSQQAADARHEPGSSR